MTAAVIAVLIIAAFAAAYRSFFFTREIILSEEVFRRLLALAERSLETMDVPVGAVVLYNDEVIGEGYNTVFRHGRAGEHAEINAISDAIQKIGFEKFSTLDRSRLVLISTFEPCTMCIGAFINYAVRNVYFLEPKNVREMLNEEMGAVRYRFGRKLVKNTGEQIQLFSLHPRYPKRGRPS